MLIKDLHKQSILQIMHKHQNNSFPLVINYSFKRNEEIHAHNTRQSSYLHPVNITTEQGKQSIEYEGPILWNEVPEEIGNIQSYNSFRKEVKKYCISQY